MRPSKDGPHWVGLIGWVNKKVNRIDASVTDHDLSYFSHVIQHNTFIMFQVMDFSLSELGISFSRLGAVTFGTLYIIDLITYAHPAPGKVESYAAIFWPFDSITWILLLVSIVLAFIMMLYFNKMYARSKDTLQLLKKKRRQLPDLLLLVGLLGRQGM